jgi:hypothetical protein
LGSGEFKAALVKDHDLADSTRAWESTGAQEIREEHWRVALARGLRQIGKTKADARTERKSAPWKIALAADLKQKTQASNRWICEQLHMGTPVGVSQMVGQLRRQAGPAASFFSELNEKPKT